MLVQPLRVNRELKQITFRTAKSNYDSAFSAPMSDTSLFPVTVVGSWPRPPWLIGGLRKRQAGELSFEEFNASADDAVLAAVKYQEDAGVDILSDGEQRRDNFYSFVVEKLEGVNLMTVAQLLSHVKDRARFEETLRALDVPAFAMKSPVATGQIKAKRGLATDELQFLEAHTKRKIKVPLPGPYMLTKSSWFPGLSDKVYPSVEDLGVEVSKLLRSEIIALRDGGAEFIQLDEPILTQMVYGAEGAESFMCAALASRKDPTEELSYALELMNRTIQGISGVRFGVHVCRGNWSRKEDVLLKGNYGPLLPWLMRMNVDQLVLEMATPRAGEIDVFKEYRNEKEIGLGVANPRTDTIEDPKQIVSRVKDFLKYFDPEKIFLNPDCGFGTFAERCVNTPDIAYRKLQAISEAAEILRREYA